MHHVFFNYPLINGHLSGFYRILNFYFTFTFKFLISIQINKFPMAIFFFISWKCNNNFFF